MKRLAFFSALILLMPFVVLSQHDDLELIVEWSPGPGLKEYTICEDPYLVRGVGNIDLGNNNQTIRMVASKVSWQYPGINVNHDQCRDATAQWWGGKGVKTPAVCPDGTFAVGFELEDFGNNDQAIVKMRCCSIGDVPATHGNSYQTTVKWYGGKGNKPLAVCKTGYYVTMVTTTDHGKNNQSISQIRCTKPVIRYR